ncbi:MAG: hypothetical protein EB127_15930 [Alphaproteobacteria bacterium]|nr:hypothetical protein [Alphaproteobacteria bacterium]
MSWILNWKGYNRKVDGIDDCQFKKDNSLENRIASSSKMISKYPDRIPIIIEKHKSCEYMNQLKSSKYLVPKEMTMGQFIVMIRSKIKLEPSTGMFVFVNNLLVPNSCCIDSLYNEHKDDDGFLYMKYSTENTFGAFGAFWGIAL